MHGGVHFSDTPDPDNVSLLDHNALPMIHDMQRYGIRVDIPALTAMSSEIRTRQTDLEDLINAHIFGYQYRSLHKKTDKATGTVTHTQSLSPFKVGSGDHVAQLLFQELKIQGDDIIPMTDGGKRFSTDDEVMEQYAHAHPVVSLILDWRELDKMRSTYTEPLVAHADANNRVHTSFNVTVTATGRLSSSSPNLQNQPKKSPEWGKRVRNCFICNPGNVLVSSDLSQIEMVLAAHESQDPNMLDVFRTGGDIHVRTACGIFDRDYAQILPLFRLHKKGKAPVEWVEVLRKFEDEERLPAKTAGFGVLYEMTDVGLQTAVISAYALAGKRATKEEWPESRCQEFITGFYDEFKMLLVYQDKQHRRVQRYGLNWDMFGRVRLVPEAKSSHKRLRNEGFRKSSNHPIQSGAQGIIKLAQASINPVCRDLVRDGYACWPLLQIHDQLIFEVSKEIAVEFGDVVKYEMENAVRISVPIKSDTKVGERWGEL